MDEVTRHAGGTAEAKAREDDEQPCLEEEEPYRMKRDVRLSALCALSSRGHDVQGRQVLHILRHLLCSLLESSCDRIGGATRGGSGHDLQIIEEGQGSWLSQLRIGHRNETPSVLPNLLKPGIDGIDRGND